MEPDEFDAKTNLLGAALHFNPELKKEVEDWINRLAADQVQRMMKNGYFFEEVMRFNMYGFRRVLHDAQMETMRKIDMNKSIL